MMLHDLSLYTIAFYNLENLFDLENDPFTNDDDFLPMAAKRWTPKRYDNKLMKLGSVIPRIGKENSPDAPIIVGLAEVENRKVITDLINTKHLKKENYSIIHFDSSDERGIDVALLYKTDIFKVETSETFSVYLQNESGERDYTRDILLVQGTLNNEPVNVLVNHWSSRREGKKETEHKRLASSNKVNTIIQSLKKENSKAKFIVMGDFNDNPDNKSVVNLEEESQLYNPFKSVWSHDNGSLNHRFEWNLFDQILISTNFFDVTKSKLEFKNAAIYNPKTLTQYHGKFQGQPFRTYVGKTYKGGYSDHFPVYIQLKPS